MNQAVWHFGISLEAAMNEAEGKAKSDKERKSRREAVLTRWLMPGKQGKQYRDPTGSMAKRV